MPDNSLILWIISSLLTITGKAPPAPDAPDESFVGVSRKVPVLRPEQMPLVWPHRPCGRPSQTPSGTLPERPSAAAPPDRSS